MIRLFDLASIWTVDLEIPIPQNSNLIKKSCRRLGGFKALLWMLWMIPVIVLYLSCLAVLSTVCVSRCLVAIVVRSPLHLSWKRDLNLNETAWLNQGLMKCSWCSRQPNNLMFPNCNKILLHTQITHTNFYIYSRINIWGTPHTSSDAGTPSTKFVSRGSDLNLRRAPCLCHLHFLCNSHKPSI